MGTHSYIFYEKEPEQYYGVFCYCDGYLSGVGAKLYQYYQEKNKIAHLISLGELISIDKECEISPRYHILDEDEVYHLGYTFANHRDGNKPLEQPIIKNCQKEINEYAKEVSYIYLWKNNKWFVFNDDKKSWLSLEDELIKLSKENNRNYLYSHKIIELNFSYDEYIQNIHRGFLILPKDNNIILIGDFIKCKATKKAGKKIHRYELMLKVKNIVEHEAIKDNYQLVVLSSPPKNVIWYEPVHFV